MPLLSNVPTSLDHIDERPSETARSAADALIRNAMPTESATQLHPMLPNMLENRFSDAVEQQHARIASGNPKQGGIDLSRYEALDAPAKGDLEGWRAALQKAYASSEYLRAREMNLGLLETFGKNAWLVANSQLEDVLKPLEKEVEEAKLEAEALEQARYATQHNASAEIKGLEEGWRKGVGRMLETQAATEKLRLHILERRRAAVS